MEKQKTGGKRKYPLNELYFDNIDTEEKAYFLGFLYADGYNFTKRTRVLLGLQARDKEILEKLSSFLQPTKPLQFSTKEYDRKKGRNSQDQYVLVINSRHISERLVELGCVYKKSLILKFPTEDQVPNYLLRHFVRGYFDGDGCVEKKGASLMGTLDFCKSLANIIKDKFNVNFYIRTKGKNNAAEACLKSKAARTFLKWIYDDSTIYLQRKYAKFLIQMEYEETLKTKKFKYFECCVVNCDNKHRSSSYCQYHYDQVRKNNKVFPKKSNFV